MAERIEPFAVTVPAGTLSSAPIDFPTTFADGIVEHVTITVPPGPSGLLALQVVHMGQPIIPRQGVTFIVADNRVIEWPLRGFPTAGTWSIRAYNEDVYDHTLYVEYHVTEIPITSYPTVTLLPIG